MFDDYPVKWLLDSEPEAVADSVGAAIFRSTDRRAGLLDAARRLRTKDSPTGYLQIIPLPDEEVGRYAAYVSFKPKRIFCKHSIYADLAADEPAARSILAHEIGHFILHPAKELRFLAVDGNQSLRFIHPNESAERQAWIFGDALLMPRIGVQSFTSTTEVAHHFNVTIEAAERRLRQCKISHKPPPSKQSTPKNDVETLWQLAKFAPGEDGNVYRQSDGGHCIQKSKFRFMGPLGWYFSDGRIIAWSETSSYFD